MLVYTYHSAVFLHIAISLLNEFRKYKQTTDIAYSWQWSNFWPVPVKSHGKTFSVVNQIEFD